jgi:hypothetical protein
MINLDSVVYSQNPYAECRGKADLIIVKPYKTAYMNGLRLFGRESISIMDIALQRTNYGLVANDKTVIKTLTPKQERQVRESLVSLSLASISFAEEFENVYLVGYAIVSLFAMILIGLHLYRKMKMPGIT